MGTNNCPDQNSSPPPLSIIALTNPTPTPPPPTKALFPLSCNTSYFFVSTSVVSSWLSIENNITFLFLWDRFQLTGLDRPCNMGFWLQAQLEEENLVLIRTKSWIQDLIARPGSIPSTFWWFLVYWLCQELFMSPFITMHPLFPLSLSPRHGHSRW